LRSGIDASTPMDAVAIKQPGNVGLEPDAIVLNSSDWLVMQTSKDSQGRYY
jgi:hypothetical protein